MIKREYEKPNNQIYESRKEKLIDNLWKQYHAAASPLEKQKIRVRVQQVEKAYEYIEERVCR